MTRLGTTTEATKQELTIGFHETSAAAEDYIWARLGNHPLFRKSAIEESSPRTIAHKYDSAGRLNPSVDAMPIDDLPTLDTHGMLAFAVANVSHEALVYGLATLVLGDKAVLWTTY